MTRAIPMLFNSTISNKIFNAMLLLSFGFSATSYASVIMTGNRIVYPSDNQSVNVEFSNKDIIPYAVQTWLDDGDVNSTALTAKAPFIASPSLFKIASNSGQVLRISFTGSKKLPQDRESVFYFNFLQIPPFNAGGEETRNKNKMLVMLKNRVKVFYRPAAIASRIGNLPDQIKLISTAQSGGTSLQLKNDSPFFVSIASIKIKQGAKLYTQSADMLPPFSQQSVTFKKLQLQKNDTAVIDYINDQGARVSHEYEINP
ncbi:fimbrial chaperone protein StbB [Rahnella variigena]|uniref:Fimbrial chaperone protein StbB n=2 Tax=Yersiniaceae TaxID=1903411 RepID=A0ABX9PYD5_9GAMM|nr:fimbrial chaperone protein StbB [Rahnella variigena]RKF69689.1 fimbrial chaperone protein StbB [Rahnella variigena]